MSEIESYRLQVVKKVLRECVEILDKLVYPYEKEDSETVRVIKRAKELLDE